MSTKAAEIWETETCFQVQYSRLGADEWFSDEEYPTQEKAIRREGQLKTMQSSEALEFRVVRKVITATIEVVHPAE